MCSRIMLVFLVMFLFGVAPNLAVGANDAASSRPGFALSLPWTMLGMWVSTVPW
jgi:hypothetical protein